MYVCLCNAVTEKHIAEAIAKGARCLKDLRSSLRVTAKCGRCASCARECLENSMNVESSYSSTVNNQVVVANNVVMAEAS